METQNQTNEKANENGFKRIVRDFALSTWAIGNQTSVLVLVLLIVIMGVTAYTTMPKENFPEVKIPEIYVATPYPGNSPLDIENLVTRPLEKEINSITGVDEISSTSIQDFSSIKVLFDFNVDVDEALQEVKDAVDKAKAELPQDLPRDPNVVKVDFSNLPVMNINLSGFDDVDLLKEYAEYLQDEIEKLSEISKVEIKGVQEKEVSINVDIYQMEARQVSLYDIETAIGRENMTISGGDILEDGMRRNVRIVGEFKNMQQIEDIVVINQRGNVYLRDIATVTYGYKETESYSRSNLQPVVTLDILKRSGTNLLNASDKIKQILAEAEENVFPQRLDVQLINDTSKQTRMMVDNLENSIISGVILVVLVLLFFLGLRNAMFVGIAIPLSMLMGFMILDFAGVTMNMMVLFSLILALGMLVDNGIVVVENIYRLMQEGVPPRQAAAEGVGEVAWPIIASTATTLAAFLPLLFWDDIWGEFMKYLPMTLIIVLSSSLFVALVVNPVLTSMLMRVEDTSGKKKHLRIWAWALGFAVLSALCYLMGANVFGSLLAIAAVIVVVHNYVFAPMSHFFLDNIMPWIEKVYSRFLKFVLSSFWPAVFLFGTFGLMYGSMMIFGSSGVQIVQIPDNEPNMIFIYTEFPIGTDIEKTNALAKEIEDRITQTLEPYEYMTEAVLANVGQGASDPQQASDNRSTPNKSRISVFFLEFEKRNGQSTNAIMEEVRAQLQDFTDEVKITISKEQNGPPQGPPINVEVTGEDYNELIELAQEVKKFLESSDVDGVEELKLDVDLDKPELLVNIDRERARQFGLSTAQIAGDIRTAVFGKEVSKFKDGEDEHPIMLRFNESQRYNADAVMNQKISFRNQNTGRMVQVPVSAMATKKEGSTIGSVKRKDLDRVISIYSNVLEGYNGREIVNAYREIMADYPLPEGYSVKFTGQQETEDETTAFLVNALMIAVFLIFLIIVTQFNSIAMPFVIILSVVFSTIGVMLGYAFLQMDFIIIMTGIGIISLAGIVVNNAIVLIDYTNLVRTRLRNQLGLNEEVRLTKAQVVEAIVQGGATRLRPVLLTAITTILGLIPLAIGFNIDFYGLLANFEPNIYLGGDNVAFWGPMAWTVIFGLAFATFLTLVIVPVMYLIVDRGTKLITGKGVNR